MTKLAARAFVVVQATPRAMSALVALAFTVARHQRLGTTHQGVTVIIRRTAALSHVVDDATTGALSTKPRALARVAALVVDARLFAGASHVAATANVAYSVLAYLVRKGAVSVAVAYCFAKSSGASLIVQTVCITVGEM